MRDPGSTLRPGEYGATGFYARLELHARLEPERAAEPERRGRNAGRRCDDWETARGSDPNDEAIREDGAAVPGFRSENTLLKNAPVKNTPWKKTYYCEGLHSRRGVTHITSIPPRQTPAVTPECRVVYNNHRSGKRQGNRVRFHDRRAAFGWAERGPRARGQEPEAGISIRIRSTCARGAVRSSSPGDGSKNGHVSKTVTSKTVVV
jgi:hypothetical protein